MPFRKGISGNIAGRPRGARSKATISAETLLQGEREGLTRRAVEAAMAGDMTAMRICLDRALPIRKRIIEPIALPPAADVLEALGVIAEAAAAGELDLDSAGALAGLLEAKRKAIETVEIEARLAALEAKHVKS